MELISCQVIRSYNLHKIMMMNRMINKNHKNHRNNKVGMIRYNNIISKISMKQ